MDELQVKVKKEQCYRWKAKDKYSKFRLYGKLTRKRDYETGAKPLFQSIKKRCYPQFLERKRIGLKIKFISDALQPYNQGFNKFFRNVAELIHGVPIACKKYGLKHNNNCIERDHEYDRQKTKIMRGFFNFESADDILNFMDLHYNYIDKPKIGKCKTLRTPAEWAGIKTGIGKRQRLLNLIKKAYDDN